MMSGVWVAVIRAVATATATGAAGGGTKPGGGANAACSGVLSVVRTTKPVALVGPGATLPGVGTWAKR